MGLTLGDVMNNNQNIVVAYNKNDYLQLIARSGEVEWKDTENLGGSLLYFLLPKAGREEAEKPQYLPTRVRIRDIDEDGKKEVIVIKNQDIAGKRLEGFRKFKNGRIMVLSWDGIGLARMWTTRKVTGHIGDFYIGDFDNDGINELVMAVNIKTGSMVMTSPKSAVVIYEFHGK